MSKKNLAAEVKKMLIADSVDLRRIGTEFLRFPLNQEYFGAEVSPEKINQYENGVMSVVLGGTDKEQPSTLGYLPEGHFEFSTGENQETMRYLIGGLSWSIKGGDFWIPERYDELVIPAHETLVLNVKQPSLYVCDYSRE